MRFGGEAFSIAITAVLILGGCRSAGEPELYRTRLMPTATATAPATPDPACAKLLFKEVGFRNRAADASLRARTGSAQDPANFNALGEWANLQRTANDLRTQRVLRGCP